MEVRRRGQRTSGHTLLQLQLLLLSTRVYPLQWITDNAAHLMRLCGGQLMVDSGRHLRKLRQNGKVLLLI